jgi:hypothetical protein
MMNIEILVLNWDFWASVWGRILEVLTFFEACYVGLDLARWVAVLLIVRSICSLWCATGEGFKFCLKGDLRALKHSDSFYEMTIILHGNGCGGPGKMAALICPKMWPPCRPIGDLS